jgi:hypothetical protein
VRVIVIIVVKRLVLWHGSVKIVIVDVRAIVDIIQRWVIAIRNKFNYQIDC